MGRLIGFLVLLATAVPPAFAQQFRGVASFAAMHPGFPCDRWLTIYGEALRRKPDLLPAMAVLWGTFGDDLTCMKRFAAVFADRPHVIQVHFSNGPCRRNQRCGEGEFFPEWSEREYNRRLESGDFIALGGVHWRMLEIEAAAKVVENANTRWLVSWELESNLTPHAAAVWEAHYRTLVGLGLLRSFALVANPHRYAWVGGAEFYETHSTSGRCRAGRGCVANEDGRYGQTVRKSMAFLKRYRDAAVVFLWRDRHQGLKGASSFTAPKRRSFEVTDRDIVELGKLLAE